MNEPPSAPTPVEPNTTLLVAETALRSNSQAAKPELIVRNVLTRFTQTRDQLAESLPESQQNAQGTR